MKFYINVPNAKQLKCAQCFSIWGDGFIWIYLFYAVSVEEYFALVACSEIIWDWMLEEDEVEEFPDTTALPADWIDSEIRDMWSKQRADGVVEGWHGDGNSARTAIMYVLWKTQGTVIRPWRKDVRFGAVRHGDAVCISLAADEPWTGRLIFDVPRHKVHMKMPLDWPRINQFPEWFTVEEGAFWTVEDLAAASKKTCTGRQMREGVAVTLEPGKELRLLVRPGS